MVKWTDDGACDPTPPADPAASRRLLAAWARHRPSTETAATLARCLAAAALLLTLVAFVAWRVGGSEGKAVAAVQAPTFARLVRSVAVGPEGDAAPVAAPLLAAFVPEAADPASRWIRPALEYDQLFAGPPDRPVGPDRLCEDLEAAGFAKARWRESAVFKGEWECASALFEDGADRGTAFLVVRGSDRDTARSLMLKLNPSSADERPALLERMRPVIAEFLLAAGATPSIDAVERIMAGEPDRFATSFGRVRIVGEHERREARIVNLVVSPRLAPPDAGACEAGCFAGFRPLHGRPRDEGRVAAR